MLSPHLLALLVLLLGPLASRSAPPPLPPLPVSPVATFRELLAMTPAGRAAALNQRPDRQRELLQARLEAYEALPVDTREDRLRATDLYWHLQQLIRRAAAERSALLAAAPADLQPILAERLTLWDRMPAADREALGQHEMAIKYFAQLRQLRPPPLPPVGQSMTAAPAIPLRLQAEFSRLTALPAGDLDRLQEQWQRFFETPSTRRERALEAMDTDERREMHQVLERFRQLTPEQRRACVGSFARFALMPHVERVEFLKSVGRWEALPPEERESWRRIVNRLPVFPPLPIPPSQPPLPSAQFSRPLLTDTRPRAAVS